MDVISKKVGTVPFMLYEVQRGKGKELAFDHDYYDLVHTKPNPYQDAVNFRVAVQMSALCQGNGYVEIQRDGAARAVALWHRDPYHTRPFIDKDNVLRYETTDGVTNPGDKRIIEAADMIHIMGPTLNGYVGLNPIEYQRRTIGQGIAMDKFTSQFFANYAIPPMVLTNKNPLPMAPEAKTKAREDWETLQSGSNRHRIAVLDSDFDFKQLQISQEDAQYLQTKLSIRRDVAAIYGVPGHMVGDTEKGIKANVEQQAQDFLSTCLGPWLTKWEFAYNTKLFASRGRSVGKFYCKYDTRDLLRPDAASRTAFNQSSIQNGYLNPNEVRELEGFNPIGPAGDEYFIQLNMQRLDQVGALVDKQLTDPANPQPGKPAPQHDTQVEDEEEERGIQYANVRATFSGLFQDATSRFSNRSKRGAQDAAQCFEPALNCLASVFKADGEEARKACAKFCDGLAARIKKGELDAEKELNRAIKSLVFASELDKANERAKATLVALEEPEEVEETLDHTTDLSDEAQKQSFELRKARMEQMMENVTR